MGDLIPEGCIVDHIHGMTSAKKRLDNRRENLRIVTISQNAQNKSKQQNLSSKYYGVSYSTERQVWCASVIIADNKVYLGRYDTEHEAAIAYDCYIWHRRQNEMLLFNLNFPESDYSSSIPYAPLAPTNEYHGVSFKNNGYEVSITIAKKQIYIGRFKNIIEAAKRYDVELVKNKLDKPLNFPDDHPGYIPDKRVMIQKEVIPGDDIHVRLTCGNAKINAAKLIIDDIDYDKIKFYNLSVGIDNRPRLRVNKKYVKLYRFILDITDASIIVDHNPDNDVFNCTRQNLKITNHAGNSELKRTQVGRKYQGVTRRKSTGTYEARIFKLGVCIFSYAHRDETVAARARDMFLIANEQYSFQKNFFDWDAIDVKQIWTALLADVSFAPKKRKL